MLSNDLPFCFEGRSASPYSEVSPTFSLYVLSRTQGVVEVYSAQQCPAGKKVRAEIWLTLFSPIHLPPYGPLPTWRKASHSSASGLGVWGQGSISCFFFFYFFFPLYSKVKFCISTKSFPSTHKHASVWKPLQNHDYSQTFAVSLPPSILIWAYGHTPRWAHTRLLKPSRRKEHFCLRTQMGLTSCHTNWRKCEAENQGEQSKLMYLRKNKGKHLSKQDPKPSSTLSFKNEGEERKFVQIRHQESLTPRDPHEEMGCQRQ